MIYFPNTLPNPSYPMDVEFEDTSVSSKFEDGSVQSRPKFTRSRDTFKVTWKRLKMAEYNTLINFVKNVAKFKANAFTWHNPDTGKDVVVRINAITNVQLVELEYHSVTLELQEV